MRWLVLALVPVSFAVSLPLTWLMVRLGHRLKAYDSPGVAGQVKAARRRVPNTGGVAIFWGIVLPMLGGLGAVSLIDPSARGEAALVMQLFPAPLRDHLAGIQAETPLAALVL